MHIAQALEQQYIEPHQIKSNQIFWSFYSRTWHIIYFLTKLDLRFIICFNGYKILLIQKLFYLWFTVAKN